jgi:hypothetical protein
MKVVEGIIAEDSGASLHKHTTELEKEKDTLRHALDQKIEDYDIIVVGTKILSAPHDQLKTHCESLEVELV